MCFKWEYFHWNVFFRKQLAYVNISDKIRAANLYKLIPQVGNQNGVTTLNGFFEKWYIAVKKKALVFIECQECHVMVEAKENHRNIFILIIFNVYSPPPNLFLVVVCLHIFNVLLFSSITLFASLISFVYKGTIIQ